MKCELSLVEANPSWVLIVLTLKFSGSHLPVVEHKPLLWSSS